MQLLMANAKVNLAKDPLMVAGDAIQWEKVEQHMQDDFWRAMFRKGGRAPYSYSSMYRALLIARWFGLSYPGLERALRVRLDFMLFCGFVVGNKLPDSCTLNRFKGKLEQSGVLSLMHDEVDRQLLDAGIRIYATHGAIVEVKFSRE